MPTKTDAILIGVGILGAVLLAAYSPGMVRASSLSATLSTSHSLSTIKLENIQGIDLVSLHVARQKGFI
ncbi:MAG: hypothetical protein PHP08_00370 [Candidatus Dojkabacteria bacterium]|nr:hypothetical protein [Candidatus Dojkabacteria bacterium]